jgi:sRNA-binding protein
VSNLQVGETVSIKINDGTIKAEIVEICEDIL